MNVKPFWIRSNGPRSRWTCSPELRRRAFAKDRLQGDLARSIEAIEKVHPELGLHLHKSINLGLEVSYSPDVVIDWLFLTRV